MKEELKIIKYGVDYVFENNPPRLKSMTDNYCDHISDGLVHAIDEPLGDEIHGQITLKCINCGELYK